MLSFLYVRDQKQILTDSPYINTFVTLSYVYPMPSPLYIKLSANTYHSIPFLSFILEMQHTKEGSCDQADNADSPDP